MHETLSLQGPKVYLCLMIVHAHNFHSRAEPAPDSRTVGSPLNLHPVLSTKDADRDPSLSVL